MFDFPIIKDPAHYSGLSGLAGTASPEGIRLLPSGNVYYVEAGHDMGTNDNDGTDPRYPLVTIAAAVAKARVGDTILVMPGTYTESVVGPVANAGANNVSLIGVGHQGSMPEWNPADTTHPCLTVNAMGWRVSGFHFDGPTAEASIKMNYLPVGGAGTEVADYGKIDNNWFDGGLYGVDLVDGIWWTEISDNLFEGIVGAGGMGIVATGWAIAVHFMNIVRNVFRNSVGGLALPLSSSQITGNIFMPIGATNTMLTVVDTTVNGGGDANIVTGNVFGGDYSNTGGYAANATDLWTGNMAEDIAEAEVGDNGMTIAQPAA